MLYQRLAVLIGGFAAGALLRRWQAYDAALSRRTMDRSSRELRAQVRVIESRLDRLEAQTQQHAAKLKEVPSVAQLVSSMDGLLAKAMTGLEGRLNAQARSIEALQLTVTQTDELLERVLESLDTLREGQES